MSGYSASERAVYTEAIRIVPGLIAAKERESPQDASELFEAYMKMAKQHGLTNQRRWSILFTATMHWAHQLAKQAAAMSKGERTTLDIVFSMGAAAANWTPEQPE